MTRHRDLTAFGGGVDRGPHVSLMDLGRMLRVAGFEEPDLADPIFGWREFDEEIHDRVYSTTLYAVRRACPDAPPAPDPHPPDRDYKWEYYHRDPEPQQATLADLGGGSV